MSKKLFFFMVLFTVCIFGAFASNTGSGMPWETVIMKVMNSVKSIVLPFGIIGVIGGAFYLATREGQGVGKLIWVFIAIAIAGTAPTVITKITGISEGAVIHEKVLENVELSDL